MRSSSIIEAKDRELLSTLAKCTDLEEELRRAKAENAKLQVERDSLDTELTRVNNELKKVVEGKGKEIEAARQDVIADYVGRMGQLKDGIRDRETRAFERGVHEHRVRYFLSKEGHQFLRIMLINTLESFVRTPEVLGVVAPGLKFLIKDACRVVLDLIEATPEQRSRYVEEEVVNGVKAEELDQLLGIDSEAPRTPAWWIPVLDKALNLFVNGTCSEAMSVQPFIRTPFLDQLRQRAIRSPRGNYPSGSIFYPPPAPAVETPAPLTPVITPTDAHSTSVDEEMVVENPPSPRPQE